MRTARDNKRSILQRLERFINNHTATALLISFALFGPPAAALGVFIGRTINF